MLTMTLRFPLGVYHAQEQADFARAEWPPHPVRLIAALVAAAHGGPADAVDAARGVIDRLAQASPPLIRAPRGLNQATTTPDADDLEPLVTELRGASRWAPRNHELSELKKGISPRDLGRGRAEVHKVGVAIGDLPVAFVWPDLEFDDDDLVTLARVAEDVTVVGTSRSPVLIAVQAGGGSLPGGLEANTAWRPSAAKAPAAANGVAVRVPNARTLAQLDTWHARRSAPVDKAGAPAKAPLVVAPRVGSVVTYVHDRACLPDGPFDPQHWGDMLVLRIDGDLIPKAPASFALARAMRKALLDTYAPPGHEGEAPSVLRGRNSDPHAAFVPLSFVAPMDDDRPGARNADGHVMGVAVVLPHQARFRGIVGQRDDVAKGLVKLIEGTPIRVPGVGDVALGPVAATDQSYNLKESRYRDASKRWTTVTPVVHSRYRTGKSLAALFDQVAAECRDVGLPTPAEVQVRRTSRLRGAPDQISRASLPPSWTGPLKGPQAHVDVWFDRKVHGPVILGRARHFGLGLCVPFHETAAAA